MHKSQEYIRQNYIVGNPAKAIIRSTPLTAIQASALHTRLANDSVNYFYSSVITFADAMRGIQQKFYCWSTVKLYYSVFYALRSILASNEICLFYVGKSPYSIHCQAGDMPTAEAGQTHQAIINVFERNFADNPILSQEIELQGPFQWLLEKRNEANYKSARFTEPDYPRHFNQVMHFGIRRSIADYVQDEEGLFAFDPDHSMIALPIKCIVFAKTELVSQNMHSLSKADQAYLSKLVKDRNGAISSFVEIICDD